MRVEYQNTGLGMARFSLYFSEERPHENDGAILGYLQQNNLVPKRMLRVLKDGERFQVMHYGQCYLGYHLDAVCQMAESEPVEVGATRKMTLHPWENLPGLRELS